MSDGPQSDLLMFFVQAEGSQPIAAESTSELAGNDRLMTGFVQDRFFELDTFTFAIDLDDDEGSTTMGGGQADPRSYGRWRALKSTDAKPHPPFKPEPQDVSVTRRIDVASPVLLKYCLDTKQFSQAVIVKRSRLGASGMMSAILRMEFRNVWIKAIEWNDGDTVTETAKFKFMSMKSTYVKRKPDGTVGALWPCEWTSVAAKTSRYDV